MADGNTLLTGGNAGDVSGNAAGDAGDKGTNAPLLDAAGQPSVDKDGKPVLLTAGQKQEVKDGKPVYDAEGKPVFAKVEAPVVPETYTFKAPEGTTLSKESEAALSEFAKANKLTQEAAQSVVEMGNQFRLQIKEQTEKAWNDLRASWRKATSEDKELGGEKLSENLGLAKVALDKFGTPALAKVIDDLGIGDHPEFIRMFHKIAKATGNDTLTEGKGGGASPESTVFKYGASDHK